MYVDSFGVRPDALLPGPLQAKEKCERSVMAPLALLQLDESYLIPANTTSSANSTSDSISARPRIIIV